MNHGKAMTKEGSALPQNRLFSGEGWKPLDLASVRQQCRGIQQNHHWDYYDIPTNIFYSHSPIPIQEVPIEFTGTHRGATVIIGFYGEVSGRKYWVTKCQCDVFELISEKTLRKKPNSPQHCCAVCRLAESRRYQQECCDLAESHGLDFPALRLRFKEARQHTGKRNSFGLIHFIKREISKLKA